jgi:cytoskeletal protein CcmA (bactofilin family)
MDSTKDSDKEPDKDDADKAEPATSESLEPSSSNEGQSSTTIDPDAPSELDSPLPEGADKPLSDVSDVKDIPKGEAGGQKAHFNIKENARNVYVLIFIGIFVVGIAITAFMAMGSKKKPAPVASIGSAALSSQALNQLAVSNSSLGTSSQTLTIQSNAVISGQLLVRGNLAVAGNIQSGGTIQASDIVASDSANLGSVQAKTLQIATNETVQGTSNIGSLIVEGTSSFSGAITASTISVTNLIISEGGSLTVPDHIGFTGTSPTHTVNNTVLGGGGSASLNGSDTSGTININTGNSPTSGCFLSATFNKSYTTTPRIIISPVGAPSGLVQFYSTITQTGFSICTDNVPPSGSVIIFDYFVMD